jgi:16S rRNA G966 N2-methylase RsmD
LIEQGAHDLEHQRACGGDTNGEYDGKAIKNYNGTGAQNASEVKARILRGMVERKTTGWRKTCTCDTTATVPCTVLDPFAGSGTTGQVALCHGRNALLIEAQEKYLPMIQQRTHVTQGLPL